MSLAKNIHYTLKISCY